MVVVERDAVVEFAFGRRHGAAGEHARRIRRADQGGDFGARPVNQRLRERVRVPAVPVGVGVPATGSRIRVRWLRPVGTARRRVCGFGCRTGGFSHIRAGLGCEPVLVGEGPQFGADGLPGGVFGQGARQVGVEQGPVAEPGRVAVNPSNVGTSIRICAKCPRRGGDTTPRIGLASSWQSHTPGCVRRATDRSRTTTRSTATGCPTRPHIDHGVRDRRRTAHHLGDDGVRSGHHIRRDFGFGGQHPQPGGRGHLAGGDRAPREFRQVAC